MTSEPLHARVTGEGPDLLLIHGVTDNLTTWDRVAPALSEHARVHALDLPGHGRSPVPRAPLGVGAMARVVSEYLDARGITRCVVAGNSLGGGVALALSAREPDRVRGVVPLGSIGLPFRLPLTLRLLRLYGVAEVMRVMASLPSWLRRASMVGMFHRDFVLPEASLEGYWSGWRAPARAPYIRSLMRVLNVAEPEAILGEIRVPVHVIHGADDRVIPARVGREIAARIPGAELTLLERTGHAPQNERPEATVTAIREMIACARQ